MSRLETTGGARLSLWFRGALLGLLLLAGSALAGGEADEAGDGSGPSRSPAADAPKAATAAGDSLGQEMSPMEKARAAQTGDGEGAAGEEEEEEAAPPTGFHPNYSSKYDVNRRTNTWTQTFSLNTTINKTRINNSTSVAIGEDTSLDRDQRTRSSTTTLAYDYSENLAVSGTLGLTRNLTDDPRTRSSVQSDRLSAKLDYIRDLLPGLKGTFATNGGTTRDKREDPLTSDRESDGPYAEGSANFAFTESGWNWTLDSRYRRSSLTSRELNTGTSTSDRNVNADLGLSFSCPVPGLTSFKLNANRNLTRTQQPFTRTVADPSGQPISQTEQETAHQLNRGFSVDAAAEPLARFNLSANYNFRNNGVERAIDLERSQESLDRAFSGNLRYIFADSTKITTRVDWGVARSTYDAESRRFLNGSTVTHTVAGSLARSLGSRTTFQASGNYQLQSYLFDDIETNLDDRDVLRGDFGATADYKPLAKLTAALRFALQHNQTIFIDETRSSGNTTQQTYTINPSVTLDLTPRIQLKEDASVIAIARVFDFNEDRNKLSRTTEFRSSVDAKLHQRLDMELRHVYRTLLDGSYGPDVDGIRKFGKASETGTNDLTLRVDYSAMAGSLIYFRVNSRISDTIQRQQVGTEFFDALSTSTATEIEMGGNLNRNLNNGTRINLQLRRVQNWDSRNRRNNYLVGDVTFAYSF